MPRLVIPIDGIRTVAPPEQELEDSVGALQIDSSGDLLPFSLDEHDPIFQNENQLKESPKKKEDQLKESPKKKGKRTPTRKPPTSSEVDSSDDEQVVVAKKPVQPATTISTQEQDDSSPGTPTLQQEEDDLMDRLDAEITKAEEEDLMERLDREIQRQEEEDLMERLLHNINQAARSEWARDNSLVEGVETVEEAKNNTDVDLYTWYIHTSRRDTSRAHPDKQSTAIVQGVEGGFLMRGTKIIPRYLSSDPSKPFVTREEFEMEVLKKNNLEWRNRHPNGYTDIQLLDTDDPYSFQLVVAAHKENLNIVQTSTAEWLRQKFMTQNLHSIREDGASVEVDIQMDLGPIGARLYESDDKLDGVWTKLIHPKGQLAQVLGPDAITSGTIILGVNGETCRSCSELGAMLAKAKTKEATIILSLLLSKFADLGKLDKSKLTDPSKSPRRRDGKPYSYTPLPNRPEKMHKPAELVAEVYSGKPPPNSPCLPAVADSEIARRRAFVDVVSNPRSVEVTVIASSERPLGSTITTLKNDDNKRKGMWIKTFKQGGQLREILGDPACTVGAAVTKVNGTVCTSADDLKTIRKSAAASHTGQSYRVTLCFYDGTDFSGVDKSKLVEGRDNPCRQNGEPYPPCSQYYAHLEEQGHSVISINDVGGGDKQQVANLAGKKRAAPEPVQEKQPSKISRQEKSNQPSSAESAEAKASREVKAQAKTKANYESYQYFTKMYFDINGIEFQRTGINKSKVNSIMWQRHKELFGHDAICNDNCQCLLKLKELTSKVLSKNAKEVQKKDHNWRNNLAPVGFVAHFVPRFLPRLIIKYPKDSHKEQIQRLVDMWAIHSRQRMFGLTCREDCACEEGWEMLFGEGDVAKAEAMSKGGSGPASKKRKLAPNSAVATASSDPSAAPLPRKTPATEKRAIVRIPYEVKFSSTAALGAYFVTEYGPEGSHCKVHSICNKGQAQSDPRIRPATIVKSVAIKSSAGVEITTHMDLKQHFDQARREGFSDVRIMFINTDVASHMSSAEGENAWNKSGHWQGKANAGWPGGAHVRPITVYKAKTREAAKARTTPTTANPTNMLHQGLGLDTRGSTEATSGHSSETPNNRQLVGETEKDWQLVADTDPVNTHRHKVPSKGILKAKGRETTQKRSIRFTGEFEERLYLTESMACERYLNRPQNSKQGPDENKASFRSEVHGEAPEEAGKTALAELIDAVHNGSCQDLINVLEAGAATHENVSVEGLPTKYKDVKQELTMLTREIEGDRSNSALRQKYKDLQSKKAVLGIYVNLSSAIPKVVFLKKWKSFEFRLHRISLRKSPSQVVPGRTDVLSGFIKTFVATNSEDLGVLPVRQISEHIMYGDEMTTYKLHNNVQVVHENRALVVELFEGLKTDPVLPAKLGSFRIEMNRIDRECPLRGWGAVTETTAQPDSSLEWAEIEIEMRVIDVQPSYYAWKSKQATDHITQQVEQIERFNEDHQQSSNSCNLTANIRGINRISLLHAAVHLNNLDLLKRVLRLGANPFLRSTMGSALAYAQQLRDRANEKAIKTSSKDDSDADRREGNLAARQEFLADHNKVVEMLRSAAQANESESAVTASTTSCEQKSDDNGELLHGDIAEHDDLYGDAGGEEYALAGPSSNDSGTGAASTSDLEIAEQQVADAKILREIMRHAPAKAGGVPNGSRCHKGHIGSQLKTRYHKRFPGIVSSRAFLQRVIYSGIVKEVKSGNISTYYFDSPDPTPHHDQPPLQRDVSGGGNASAGHDGNQPSATSGVSIPGVSYDDLYGDVVVEGNANTRSLSNDSPTPATLKPISRTLRDLGESVSQQLYDADMLRKIMVDAPRKAGGFGWGLKSYVGSQVKIRNPDRFPDHDSLTNYLQRVVSSGIVIEEGAGAKKIWRLHGDVAGEGNGIRRSSSIDSGTTAASKPNPETLAQRSKQQTDEAKILWMIMKDASDTAGGEDGSQGKKSFVAAQLGSRFANLFPDRVSVREFIHRAIASGVVKEKGTGANAILYFPNSNATGNHSRFPSQTSKSYPQQNDRLPELSEADFAILHTDVRRCKKGDRPGQCWHAANGGCHFWHVSQLLGPGLIDDESKFVGAQLPKLDHSALNVVTRCFNGLEYVTATYLDYKTKMIYFAEGGPLSQLNRKQMTFWYPRREAAVEALKRVVFLANSTTG